MSFKCDICAKPQLPRVQQVLRSVQIGVINEIRRSLGTQEKNIDDPKFSITAKCCPECLDRLDVRAQEIARERERQKYLDRQGKELATASVGARVETTPLTQEEPRRTRVSAPRSWR